MSSSPGRATRSWSAASIPLDVLDFITAEDPEDTWELFEKIGTGYDLHLFIFIIFYLFIFIIFNYSFFYKYIFFLTIFSEHMVQFSKL